MDSHIVLHSRRKNVTIQETQDFIFKKDLVILLQMRTITYYKESLGEVLQNFRLQNHTDI